MNITISNASVRGRVSAVCYVSYTCIKVYLFLQVQLTYLLIRTDNFEMQKEDMCGDMLTFHLLSSVAYVKHIYVIEHGVKKNC